MDIKFNNVTYTYEAGTPLAHDAIKDLTFELPSGSFTAIIGHTGSGKSTLIKHLNALLKPSQGSVRIGNKSITSMTSEKNLKALRQKVGTVFQFPEAQLFGQTVAEDIVFGPMNYGLSYDEALEVAKEKLKLVGLDDSFLERSPFELSGGQQRRIAIAGVLALEPSVLVLDEPSAGLDPDGQDKLLALINTLHQQAGTTIVLITHQMEHVVQYAEHVIVLDHGQILAQGTPHAIFEQTALLEQAGLQLPPVAKLAQEIAETLAIHFAPLPLTLEELADALDAHLSGDTSHEK